MNSVGENNNGPTQGVVDELRCGVGLITSLDDLSYARGASGSVGAQFRHNLDFAVCLLRGIPIGQIDYNDRERDTRVEFDRHYACERFTRVIEKLSDIQPRSLGRSVLVRSEVDKNTWLASNIAREIEFLHSHTVHHHALIAEKLASYRIDTPLTFGVAPSTLQHWKKQAA